MQTILLVGADSVVGAALAAVLGGSHRVAGLMNRAAADAEIAGCEILLPAGDDERSACRVLAAVRPDWTVYCGPGAESCWNESPRPAMDEASVHAARTWARATRETGSDFACLSCDAVFTGPWMFHRETSRCSCDSRQARLLRAIEAAVVEEHQQALVVRTHVFGWMPEAFGSGWIERLLADLEAESTGALDGIRHATPLLAADLAEILHKAWQAGLAGVFHIAGAERTNPARFAARLAQEFELPAPRHAGTASLLERPTGFGCGETSLRTTKIRRALGIGLPMLADGLRRLREQRGGGFGDRLDGATPAAQVQAA